MTKRIQVSLLSILLAAFAAHPWYGQAQTGRGSPDSRANQQQYEPSQARDQIRSKVNEVIVPVTVTDKNGKSVLDLSQADFHVFDNGAEQSIDEWDLGGVPLAVALVVETSSRIKAMARPIHSMSSIFTETVMALGGEAAVITYDSEVQVRQDFTQDHDVVGNAIATLQFQVPERKLYDGMAKAVELLKAQPITYRRVMLLIGESQDEESQAKLAQVVREAAQANISIYALGMSSIAADLRGNHNGVDPIKLPGLPPIKSVPCRDIKGRPCYDFITPAIWLLERGTNEIKSHQLEIAAAATGGIHYRTFRDAAIGSALDRIGGELHAQYMLSYATGTNPRPGFNEIKVTVSRPDITIRTRPGYYVFPTQ